MLKSNIALSRFVKDRRAEIGKPQWKVAEEVGVVQGTLSNLEVGKPIRLYPAIINGLAKSLEVTPEQLLQLATGEISEERAKELSLSPVRAVGMVRKVVAVDELVTAEDLTMLVEVRKGFGEMFTLDLVIDLIQRRHREHEAKKDRC